MTFSVSMSPSKKNLPNSKKTLTFRSCLFLVGAVGIFAHWPGLIDDSVMWDDWIMFAWIAQSQPDWIFQFFHNYGVTPYCLVYFPFTLFTNDPTTSFLISKILVFLGVILNAILIMLISNRVAHKNLIFATLAGISAACFPALSGEGFRISGLFFYFFIPLFLLGILFFTIIASSKKFRPFLRITALTILLLSFSLNSLLVLFYALVPAVFYASLSLEKPSLQDLFLKGKKFLFRHLDFLALPLLFWFLKYTFTPRVGIYTRYNKIHFDWPGIFHAYEQLIPHILQATLFVPLSIQFVLWITVVVFIFTTFTGQPILTRIENSTKITKNHMIVLLGLGLLALFGAALPYYMVGRRSFQAFGFMSRDNAIFPLSIGWITAALFCMFLSPQSFLKIHQTWNLSYLLRRLMLGVFAALIISQSLSNWQNHADWQSHYAYYRSTLEKITHEKLVNQASVIHVIDQIPGDRSLILYKYPSSIWTEIISSAFKKTTRLAILLPPENGRFFTQNEINQRLKESEEIDFMLKDIDVNGPQIRLTIEPGSGAQSPIRIALAYWRARFFVPKDMPGLLNSLTRVKIEKIPTEKE